MTTTHARSGEVRRAAARLWLPRQRAEQHASGRHGPGGTGDPFAPEAFRRLPWAFAALACATWAFAFPLISNLASQRAWGWSAGAGYVVAGLCVALLPRSRALRVAVATALVGAVVVPLILLLARSEAQSEVWVVQASADRLVHGGSPYLAHPHHYTGYTPYLPGMALFGFPHLILPGSLGDARVWFLGVFLWDPLESTCRHASLSIL